MRHMTVYKDKYEKQQVSQNNTYETYSYFLFYFVRLINDFTTHYCDVSAI